MVFLTLFLFFTSKFPIIEEYKDHVEVVQESRRKWEPLTEEELKDYGRKWKKETKVSFSSKSSEDERKLTNE